MKKKYFYLILGLIIIVALGLFLATYIILQRDSTTGEEGGGQTNPFANFFPFGKPSEPTTGTTPGQGVGTTGGTGNTPLFGQEITNPLRQISQTPVAGSYTVLRGGKTYALHVERNTGNVFETKLEDMTQNRLSNALIPRIQEAFFGNNGKSVVLRYLEEPLDTIKSFVLDVTNPLKPKIGSVVVSATGTPDTIPNGIFLPKDIMNVFPTRDGSNMFYSTRSSDFATRKFTGTAYNSIKGTSADVFQSPFSDWLPVFWDGTTVFLQTKASQLVPGYLYSFNTKTGGTQKILSEKNGLTTLPSPDQQKILYSVSTRGGIALYLNDRKGVYGADMEIQTLPEKCVWTNDSIYLYCAVPNFIPSAIYPDDWYQGSVSLNDNIMKIDIKSGDTTSVLIPDNRANQQMDIINMSLSPDEKYLTFTNKKDETLWMYDLTGAE